MPVRTLKYWGKAIALNRRIPIFFEAASFEQKRALDSGLVGWILLAALLWVLGDLGT